MEPLFTHRHAVHRRRLEPVVMYLAVGESYITANRQTTVVVGLYILNHPAHHVIQFNLVTITIGQCPPHRHTTPAPCAHRVRKNCNLHIAHNILFFVYNKEQQTRENVLRGMSQINLQTGADEHLPLFVNYLTSTFLPLIM